MKDALEEKLTLKQRVLKVVDFIMYVVFFTIGAVLSKILVVGGGGQNVIWIFIPMGIYRTARIKFNILVASVIAGLGSMGCVFGFIAAISKW